MLSHTQLSMNWGQQLGIASNSSNMLEQRLAEQRLREEALAAEERRDAEHDKPRPEPFEWSRG